MTDQQHYSTHETLNALRLPIRLGGHICLDFTNTVEPRHATEPREFLSTYHHLLAWCWRTGLLTEDQTQHLYTVAHEHPADAQAALQYALEVRETLCRIFATQIAHHALHNADLLPLNAILERLLPLRRLEMREDSCVWTWQQDGEHLERIVLPIVVAAADLLTSEQLQQVRQCPNCGWLFLDTSRNHRRRWCSMDFCGSKMKSRRQYERKRQQTHT